MGMLTPREIALQLMLSDTEGVSAPINIFNQELTSIHTVLKLRRNMDASSSHIAWRIPNSRTVITKAFLV